MLACSSADAQTVNIDVVIASPTCSTSTVLVISWCIRNRVLLQI